jgi:hypothetical protein
MNFTFDELKAEIGNLHLQVLALTKLLTERDAKIAQLEAAAKAAEAVKA